VKKFVEEEFKVDPSDPDPMDDIELNSGDDDSDDDEQAIQTDNLMLCVYDKVRHQKSKWSCQFRHGLLHLAGRDYVFQKGTGNFDWYD